MHASVVSAQSDCLGGIRVEGVVTDVTGAVIPGAAVQAATGEIATTNATGEFTLGCVRRSSVDLTARADGFGPTTMAAHAHLGGAAHLTFRLAPAAVQTEVDAAADPTGVDADHIAGSRTLGAAEVNRLADDPDEFMRELQALAASGGGIPGSAVLRVDGFQNTSAMPPKASIASIRINPDMFAAQYEEPPYFGGVIEITTKAGAASYHGALFFTDCDSSFNATDPFSNAPTPAGRRRYGFELSGPITAKRSDFAVALEKRDIDEFNVINAVTLSPDFTPVPVQQPIGAPQRLWVGSARGDVQVTPNDTATVSYSANANTLGNQGTGGFALQEAGYNSHINEYDLRLTNFQTLSLSLLHETRVKYTWRRTEQLPLSTAPSLNVEGYFVGGGSTGQSLNDRERDLEVDDDVILTRGKHTAAFGAQSLGIFSHLYEPNTFNGQYIFGGGTAAVLDADQNATGQTAYITPLEQYRRALLNLPGGSPTAFQITQGNPLVSFTQWRLALYGQDAIKLSPNLTFAAGFRYQFQTSPGSFGNYSPRLSLGWSPDTKQKLVFHVRAGIFRDPNPPAYTADVYRLNGALQAEQTVYSPGYLAPLTPTATSINVNTLYAFPHTLVQESSLQSNFCVEYTLPSAWHAYSTLYWAETWGKLRLRNINAPEVGASDGTSVDPAAALLAPRPQLGTTNILQYENSGHVAGNIVALGVDRFSGKRAGVSVTYVHVNVKSDAEQMPGGSPEQLVGSPQSSYTKAGESARADFQDKNAVYATLLLHLPYKLEISSVFDARQGYPFNVITGTDANGDGIFNDRPSFAAAPGAGVFSTPLGLLDTNTVIGTVPRNFGTLPAVMHLDTSVSRSYTVH